MMVEIHVIKVTSTLIKNSRDKLVVEAYATEDGIKPLVFGSFETAADTANTMQSRQDEAATMNDSLMVQYVAETVVLELP